MERLVDVAVELWRIGNPRGLFREVRAATLMFADSFNGDLPSKAQEKREYTETIIFVQGFFASIFFYRCFMEFFHENNVRVVCPLRLTRNTIGYSQAHKLISNTIKRVEDKTCKPPKLVGHSKGGTDITGVLAKHSEIKEVFLLAAPLRGRSLGALDAYIKLFHKNPGEPVDHDVLADPAIQKKITTISSHADHIVPPHEAGLPGAHAEIVIEQDYAKQSTWDSHIGLPYHARHKILELLSEKRTEKAA